MLLMEEGFILLIRGYEYVPPKGIVKDGGITVSGYCDAPKLSPSAYLDPRLLNLQDSPSPYYLKPPCIMHCRVQVVRLAFFV